MAGHGAPDTRPDHEDLVDWPRRLESELPLLEEVLAAAPSRRVLDLGCGGGHHARFLAARGFDVVGIDASEERLARAAAAAPEEGDGDGRVEYLLGDMGAVERLVRGHFGAALCLGDTVAQLLSPESLARMMAGVRRRLLPGAPLLLQTHNWDRLLDRDERALPPLVRRDADGDDVLLRLLRPQEDGFVGVASSLLRYAPRAEPPLSVVSTHHGHLRGWRHEELETVLVVSRFSELQSWGGFDRRPFDAGDSPELVLLAR